MKTMLGLLKLYVRNSQLRIQQDMAYRANFFIGVVIAAVGSSVPALFQYLIFTKTRGFPGWNLDQIILFQGMMLAIMGLQNTLFGQVRTVMDDLVRKGDFDRLLLKPYPPIGVIMASGFSGNEAGTFFTGCALVIYSSIKMGITVGVLQVGLLLVTVISGLAFFVSANIVFCAIMMIFVDSLGNWDLFRAILNVSQYPKEIFPKLLQTIFVTAAPFMVLVYYPAQVLLNRIDIMIVFSLLSSFLFLYISILLWNRFLKKYSSAGG